MVLFCDPLSNLKPTYGNGGWNIVPPPEEWLLVRKTLQNSARSHCNLAVTHLHPEASTRSLLEQRQDTAHAQPPHRNPGATGEEDTGMPPLPPKKLCTSATAVKLKTHSDKAVGCSPGTLCRASAGKHTPIGKLCRVRPSVLGHEGAAMAVKGTESQLLDNAAAIMNTSLGSSVGSIALSRRWSAALSTSHGSYPRLLPCFFMSSKGMQQETVVMGFNPLCIQGLALAAVGDNHSHWQPWWQPVMVTSMSQHLYDAPYY